MTEKGSAPIELALALLVLLVPMALAVLSFGPVLEQRNLVRGLAVEAARTIVVSEGNVERALDRLGRDAAASGVDPALVSVAVCGGQLERLGGPVPHCDLDRVGAVEVSVRLPVRPGLLPAGPTTVSYTHREPLDPYRSR